MVMTRNQIKQVEAAREGPRTRSKAAVLENWQQKQEPVKRHTVRWGSEESAAAKVLVSLKNTPVSVEAFSGSGSGSSQRPRRNCANY